MKSLAGIPWRVAFALQDDGWILRSDIVWERPQKIESVKDRPTHGHEYVFMFAKSQHYYYDSAYMKRETGGNMSTVWRFTETRFTGAHVAVFPPELVERILLAATPENGFVLDPFGGSGTVGLVARQHARQYVISEINPDFAELARRRISEGVTPDDKMRLHQQRLF